jgi:hypothetical protein
MTHYIGAVANWEWARDRGERRMSPADLRDDVLATSVGILRAPSRMQFEFTLKEKP